MPKVIFLPNKLQPEERSVDVEVGDTLLMAAEKAGVPMGHNCGGVCGCSTCHVYIRVGEASLSEQEDPEADRLDMAFQVKPCSRLGCQAEIKEGTVTVELTQESLKSYLDENADERKAFAAKGITI
jgi:ferredoxin, 2Fe-2S